jgi:hypothetical protein
MIGGAMSAQRALTSAVYAPPILDLEMDRLAMEDALGELSARLRRVEDELAIMRLLAAYGPAVDAGASRAAAELWTGDGTYDVGGVARAAGHDQLTSLYDGEQHQTIIGGGAAHLTGGPVVTIDGDRATAVAHSLVVRHDEQGFRVWRAAANRWTLVRTAAGWRIEERLNRVLDGSAQARELLGGQG